MFIYLTCAFIMAVSSPADSSKTAEKNFAPPQKSHTFVLSSGIKYRKAPTAWIKTFKN